MKLMIYYSIIPSFNTLFLVFVIMLFITVYTLGYIILKLLNPKKYRILYFFFYSWLIWILIFITFLPFNRGYESITQNDDIFGSIVTAIFVSIYFPFHHLLGIISLLILIKRKYLSLE